MRVAVAALILVLSRTGSAEPDDAAALFAEGRALNASGDYAAACKKLTRSFELDPEPGTELNLGDCHSHLGHVAIAWHMFDDAARRWAKTHDQRESYAREHADALVPQLGAVVVRIAQPAPDGLAITIGGHAAAADAEVRELVDPGPVEVVVTAPGVPKFTRSASPAAGQTVTIDVPAFAGSPAPPVDTRRRHRLYLAAGLAGAGAFTLVIASVVALQARADYQAIQNAHCPTGDPPQCDTPMSAAQLSEAASRGDTATYITIGGLVLAGAGVAVYLTAPHAVVVAPTATASSAGIEISGRF